MRDVSGRRGSESKFSASYLYPVDGRRLHGLPVELQTQARSLWGLDPAVSTSAENLLHPVLVSVVGNGLLEVTAQVVRQGQVKICGRYQGASPSSPLNENLYFVSLNSQLAKGLRFPKTLPLDLMRSKTLDFYEETVQFLELERCPNNPR